MRGESLGARITIILKVARVSWLFLFFCWTRVRARGEPGSEDNYYPKGRKGELVVPFFFASSRAIPLLNSPP